MYFSKYIKESIIKRKNPAKIKFRWENRILFIYNKLGQINQKLQKSLKDYIS